MSALERFGPVLHPGYKLVYQFTSVYKFVYEFARRGLVDKFMYVHVMGITTSGKNPFCPGWFGPLVPVPQPGLANRDEC